MCGRYYRKGDKQKIAEAFHAKIVDDGTPNPPWDYNVAPTTIQPIIRNNRDTNKRELVSIRWGLVPWSIKSLDQLKGRSTINARCEKITTGWWAQPFKKRRCIVPRPVSTSGASPIENPFGFDLTNGKMMGFAGLWDAWKNPANGQWLQSFTIVITDPNELMASVHDRMPVILHPGDFDRWLERDSDPARPPIDLLRPFAADEMEVFEVSTDVGNVKNNSPKLLNSQ